MKLLLVKEGGLLEEFKKWIGIGDITPETITAAFKALKDGKYLDFASQILKLLGVTRESIAGLIPEIPYSVFMGLWGFGEKLITNGIGEAKKFLLDVIGENVAAVIGLETFDLLYETILIKKDGIKQVLIDLLPKAIRDMLSQLVKNKILGPIFGVLHTVSGHCKNATDFVGEFVTIFREAASGTTSETLTTKVRDILVKQVPHVFEFLGNLIFGDNIVETFKNTVILIRGAALELINKAIRWAIEFFYPPVNLLTENLRNAGVNPLTPPAYGTFATGENFVLYATMDGKLRISWNPDIPLEELGDSVKNPESCPCDYSEIQSTLRKTANDSGKSPATREPDVFVESTDAIENKAVELEACEICPEPRADGCCGDFNSVGGDKVGGPAPSTETLVRRGSSIETKTRLEKQALQAEGAGNARNGVAYGHGVSVSSMKSNEKLANDPTDFSAATRAAFVAAGFPVRYTPTKSDCDHHTVQLPKPLSVEDVKKFNQVLGR